MSEEKAPYITATKHTRLWGGPAELASRLSNNLHHFKGAKLSVFMCITLRADKYGNAEISLKEISRRTGYHKPAVLDAIQNLCETSLDGSNPVLTKTQRTNENGVNDTNLYSVFPGSR